MLDSVSLDQAGLNLRLGDDCLREDVVFLGPGVLLEFLLQNVVLELLFLPPLTLQVLSHIQRSQPGALFLLGLVHRNAVQDLVSLL